MTLEESVVQIVRTMEAAGHQTTWVILHLRVDGVPKTGTLFLSIDPDIAARALDALRAADCLCNTDLGTYP